MAHELPDLPPGKLRTVQALVEDAIDEGWDQDRLMAELQRVVGLSARDAQAVRSRRKALKAAGTAPGKLKRDIDSYTDTLIARRAATIAATERLTVEQGDLLSTAPAGSKKKWVTHKDEKTCPVCAPLHGSVKPLAHDYGNGKTHPPLHPNCRCKLKIVRSEVSKSRDGDGDGRIYDGTPRERPALLEGQIGPLTFRPVRQGNAVYLMNLNIPASKRGHGEGSKAMKTLVDQADALGVELILHTGKARDDIRQWYARYGFVAEAPDALGIPMRRKVK